MTQLTEIPMGYIEWSLVIRLVIVGAFLFWTTRWKNKQFWSTRGDELAGTIVVAFFVVVHFVFMPMANLSGFADAFTFSGNTGFIEYFFYDLLFRFTSLVIVPVPIIWCWLGLYLVVMFMVNACFHFLPNVGIFGKIVTGIFVILILTLGRWSIFVLPFTIE